MITSSSSSDSQAELRADQAYRAFFVSQMPDPFPPFVIPPDAPQTVRSKKRSLLTRSRIILAISVSLLALLLGSLRNNVPTERPTPAGADGANAKHVKDLLNRPK
jgi:hypothetical protein